MVLIRNSPSHSSSKRRFIFMLYNSVCSNLWSTDFSLPPSSLSSGSLCILLVFFSGILQDNSHFLIVSPDRFFFTVSALFSLFFFLELADDSMVYL